MADFSTDEKTNVLFKNFIGVPNTKKDREWYQESYKAGVDGALSSGHALNYNNSVDLENVWAADISTNFSASNESVTLNMYVPGTYTVGNVSRDELGSVLKVEKLKLQRVESENDQSWYCLGNNSVNVLKNIIPFNYKESGSSRPYAYILYNGPTNEMAYGATGGNWMIDHKSGVVYIPDTSDISGGIHASGLYLTFYKYIGEPLSNIIFTDDNNVKFGVLKNKYEIFKNEREVFDSSFVGETPPTGYTSSNYVNTLFDEINFYGDYVVGNTYNNWGAGVYNVRSGERVFRYWDKAWTFANNNTYVAFAGDPELNYNTSNNNTVDVYNIHTGELAHTFTSTERRFGISVGFSDTYFALSSPYQSTYVGHIYIYDFNWNLVYTKKGIDTYTDYIGIYPFGIKMHKDYLLAPGLTYAENNNGYYGGLHLFSITGSETPITTFVVTDTKERVDISNINLGNSTLYGIALSTTYVATGTNGNKVYVWKINDTNTWNTLYGIYTPEYKMFTPPTDLSANMFGSGVAIYNDEYVVISSNRNNFYTKVHIYHIETGELVQTLDDPNDGGDYFGRWVQVHNDTLVISSDHEDTGGSNYGSAYIYTSTTKSNVQLLTNQLPRLHVDLGGNVGIGTTEPSYKLDVNGDARIRGNILGNTTFMGGNVGIGTASPGAKLHIFNQVATTDPTNTSFPTYDTQVLLKLESGYDFDYDDDAGGIHEGGVAIGFHTFNALNSTSLYQHPFEAARITAVCNESGGGENKGDLLFLTNHNGEVQMPTNRLNADYEKMRITYNGNVGIGTTSPDSKLHIQDVNDTTLKIETGNNTTRKTANILFRTDDTGTAQSHYDAAKIVSGFDDTPYNASYISFQTHHGEDPSWNTSMKIKGGNVGIGTTSPTQQLQVGPILTFQSIKLDLTEKVSTKFHRYDFYTGPGSIGTGVRVRLSKPSYPVFSLDVEGFPAWHGNRPASYWTVNSYFGGSVVLVGKIFVSYYNNYMSIWLKGGVEYNCIVENGGTIVDMVDLTIDTEENIQSGSNSDDRIKHNEVHVNNGLHIINQLKPQKYIKTQSMYEKDHNFNLDGSGNPLDASGNSLSIQEWKIETGFIAQDIEKIDELKYMVVPGTMTDMCGNQIKTIEYKDIFVYNVAATQELYTEQQLDKARIVELESQLENVLVRLAELEGQ